MIWKDHHAEGGDLIAWDEQPLAVTHRLKAGRTSNHFLVEKHAAPVGFPVQVPRAGEDAEDFLATPSLHPADDSLASVGEPIQQAVPRCRRQAACSNLAGNPALDPFAQNALPEFGALSLL